MTVESKWTLPTPEYRSRSFSRLWWGKVCRPRVKAPTLPQLRAEDIDVVYPSVGFGKEGTKIDWFSGPYTPRVSARVLPFFRPR